MAISSTLVGTVPGTVANVVKKSILFLRIGDGECRGADAGADDSHYFSTCLKMTFA